MTSSQIGLERSHCHLCDRAECTLHKVHLPRLLFQCETSNEICLEGRNIWLLHEVVYRKHFLFLSHLWHYNKAYFFLIYSARRFHCLHNMIPAKYFWFPKEPALTVQRTSIEREDFFFPCHNSMVLLAEFSIKDSNFSTKKLQAEKNPFQNQIFWEVCPTNTPSSLIFVSFDRR